MNKPDRAASPVSASAVAAHDLLLPASSGWVAEYTASEVADCDGWLGYESIHPLTWVPESAPVNCPQSLE